MKQLFNEKEMIGKTIEKISFDNMGNIAIFTKNDFIVIEEGIVLKSLIEKTEDYTPGQLYDLEILNKEDRKEYEQYLKLYEKFGELNV